MSTPAQMKATVLGFYRDALAAGQLGTLQNLFSPDYQPRTAPLKDVPVLDSGLLALHERLQERGRIPHKVYRAIVDDDLVWVHARYDGMVPVAGADIFRFDASGRIAEHWNARQRIPQDAGRGDDRFTGGGSADLPMTDARRVEIKQILRNTMMEMWSKGNAALVPVFYDESYIQHNPDMPGGYRRIKEIMETEIPKYIQATNGPFPVNIHRMGAEGDLIFVHYSIFMAGINRNAGAKSTNVDVFRIGPHNKMIEHWDVLQMEVEPLPDDSTLF
jgi:predicted SnoaL-like aldol condensation-catalyzing enzyme